MRTLYIIPARGGSKRIPKKNIKLLGGKPLIYYSIDFARKFAQDEDICVSTDCEEIINAVESYGLNIPFIRPSELSSDSSGTHDVLMHAFEFFVRKGRYYDAILLLQPTSPFRLEQHLKEVWNIYTPDIDMVVSVSESHQNPYFNLFEESELGFLKKSKNGKFASRQEIPAVYCYNGSLYLINTKSLLEQPLHTFRRVKKYVMDDLYSVDIDTPLDWVIAEVILDRNIITFNNKVS